MEEQQQTSVATAPADKKKDKKKEKATAAQVPEQEWIKHRIALWEGLKKKQQEEQAAASERSIRITLLDARVVDGVAGKTTPLDVAASISKKLRDETCVARFNGQLVDAWRPLEEDGTLELLSVDSPEARNVFWHSSAHILGQALERKYGIKLCVGPPAKEGDKYHFFYEGRMSDDEIKVSKDDYKELNRIIAQIIREKQTFERMTVPKDVALEMFKYNPYKSHMLRNKVPDGGSCTVYRCGNLIDPCRGPHVPNTGFVKVLEVMDNSSSYWQANKDNDSLQRVYGIAFRSKEELEQYKHELAEAEKRNHQNLGKAQELFFFHPLTPGSCFWLPHGARIYNRLLEFIRSEYRKRGFEEVITPNVYNADLWLTSGHWQHYKENMFTFECEGRQFALKPMNCVTGDALVGLASHASVRLDSLEGNKGAVLAYNPNMPGLVPSAMWAFQDKGEKDCITVVLEDSREVTLTPDHRVMTIDGWREARELVKGQSRVLVGAMPPVVDWAQADYAWSAQLTDKFKLSCAMPEERVRALAFMRLAGLVWTDGTISARDNGCQVYLGHQFDVDAVRRDIATVTGTSAPEAAFDNNHNMWRQTVPVTVASALAVLLGSACGRMEVSAAWPELFTSGSFPVALLRHLLAGMFGGAGWGPQLRERDGGEWVEVYLALSKAESQLPSLKAFFETMVALMASAGVPGCTMNGPYKNQEGSGWYYCIKVPAAGTPAFMRHVGYACNVSKAQRGAIMASYYTLRAAVIGQAERFAARCVELSGYGSDAKKMPLSKAHALAKAEFEEREHIWAPDASIPSYKTLKARLRLNTATHCIGERGFFTPTQFAEAIGAKPMLLEGRYAVQRGLAPSAWSLAVVAVRNAGKRRVFDITVDPAEESFMANGVIVHNCPGHCLMFKHRTRSYRELPIRFADFGVLHRNEYSGALTGLTRVRRFQQDDAHIFCATNQIEKEVSGCLDFLQHVYGIFGFEFSLELSTRPEKYLGALETWDNAESQLKTVLDKFGKPWSLNPGDGAFYGPKIDIKIKDAIRRSHQCATIQLDFQLPIRFELDYMSGEKDGDLARPVIIHRAILGSVERMTAILLEHTAGKWPFWLSPRQVIVIPVAANDPAQNEYVEKVKSRIHDVGFYVDSELSDKKLDKKIRESQLAQYNYILVCGKEEIESNTVNVRTRDNQRHGTISLDDLIAKFKDHVAKYE